MQQPSAMAGGSAASQPQLPAPAAAAPQNCDTLDTPSVWRTNRTHAAARADARVSSGMDEIEIPAFLRKQAD